MTSIRFKSPDYSSQKGKRFTKQNKKYNYLVIGKVDKDGPAFKAGLNNNYIGYAIVRVNGIEMVDADDFMASIDQTKNPNETFSITIQRLFEKNSEQEQLLIRKITEDVQLFTENGILSCNRKHGK